MSKKIEQISLHPYEVLFQYGSTRSGFLLQVVYADGEQTWGEVAPLPRWSQETAQEAKQQLEEKTEAIFAVQWEESSYVQKLHDLELFPSVLFGLESALLQKLCPVLQGDIAISAWLVGTPEQIFEQARFRLREGYFSAKLKVSQLTYAEAYDVIHALKDHFRLRIDVNRAWNSEESSAFFSQFPLDSFDYVEEPFQDPHQLHLFPHPLAVDESFPTALSLNDLEDLPTLKAIIYKPTIQGGMCHSLKLKSWCQERGVELIFSSSCETDIGLAHVASIPFRLGLSSPVGIGTYHHLEQHLSAHPFVLSGPYLSIPSSVHPHPYFLHHQNRIC